MSQRFEKVSLIAVNAGYSHSSLALRCLSKSLGEGAICHEYTINDIASNVAAELYKDSCSLYAFSCYIWNICFVSDVCRILKAAKPEAKILLGGPEVSYDAKAFMEENDFVDYIICGEGDIAICDFVNGVKKADVGGLVYKSGGEIVANPGCIVENLDSLPRLYNKDELGLFENKILYYETSRGCPYKCSYCLSSTSHGVRFFSLERVFEDFLMFMHSGVKLVKLVDRTFNIDKKRTAEILRFILANNKNTCFHFEITADILDEEIMDLLCSAPKDFFQLEIGVQSTNEKTLAAIDRKTDLQKLFMNVKRLKNAKNMHIHLDLIAGLPYEDYKSFTRSFDDVFSLAPDMLQLGFLKLLKGTKIRTEEQKFSYRYNPKPTYEVISNEFITYDEIILLKGIEDMVERYYNLASFEKSLDCALSHYKSAFEFFFDLALFWHENGYNKRPQSKKTLYEIFAEFYKKNIRVDTELFLDCLKFDFIKNNRNMTLPEWAPRTGDKAFYNRAYEFLSSDAEAKYVSFHAGEKVSQLMRIYKVEKFNFDVLGTQNFGQCVVLFDYEKNSFKKIEEKF